MRHRGAISLASAATITTAAASFAYLAAPRRPVLALRRRNSNTSAMPPIVATPPPPPPPPPARPTRAVNLRDLGDVGGGLQPGRVYRCSQVFEPALLRDLGVRTVVDLRGRREVRRAAAAEDARRRRATLAGQEQGLRPLDVLAEEEERREPRGGGGQQGNSAGAATAGAADAADDARITALASAGDAPPSAVGAQGATIVAVPVEAALAAGNTPTTTTTTTTTPTTATLLADVLPPWRLAVEAARRFPLSILAAAACRALTLRDPGPVIAEAFANERIVGLGRYYSMIFEASGPAIGDAMRALANPGALPALVHCAQGKDRTACFALVLLDLCGADEGEIVADYEKSERELRRYRRRLARTVAGAAAERVEDDEEDDGGAAAAAAAGEAAQDKEEKDDPSSWPIALSEKMIQAQGSVARGALRELRQKYGGAERYLVRKGKMTEGEVAALRRALVE
jgi:hypothetical protein